MKSNRISYRESPNDMKRQPKPTKTDMKPGANPHDRFARKMIGDPLIAADLLRWGNIWKSDTMTQSENT